MFGYCLRSFHYPLLQPRTNISFKNTSFPFIAFYLSIFELCFFPPTCKFYWIEFLFMFWALRPYSHRLTTLKKGEVCLLTTGLGLWRLLLGRDSGNRRKLTGAEKVSQHIGSCVKSAHDLLPSLQTPKIFNKVYAFFICPSLSPTICRAEPVCLSVYLSI